MLSFEEARERLARIPALEISRNEPLAAHTRFGIGGPAALLAQARAEDAFIEALRVARGSGLPWMVIGAGTNLIVSDAGFEGIVLRYAGAGIRGPRECMEVEAGADLQELVDYAIARGGAGLERMTGIPGQAGAAIYGNAGAYGSSMADFVRSVRYFDGEAVRELDHAACAFRYRSSIFKQRKDWLILSAVLACPAGEPAALRAKADEIRAIRDAKYPPAMRCAGSIFKNLLFDELPPRAKAAVPPEIIKGGKVPAAWFLDVTGVKGLRSGGVRVADYHANLIYNEGGATARALREVIDELKRRVRERFGLELEEEVQYVGFEALPGLDTLERTPRILDALLEGLREADLLWQPAPGRWSIQEALAHLAHAEEHCFGRRARAFLAQLEPELASYEAEDFRAEPLEGALIRFRESRRANLDLLAATPASAAARVARHVSLGRVTLGEMLNEWAFHDLGHIRQVAEIVRARRYYEHMGPWRPHYEVKP
jgi:UDP-N-acetylmuramate dehydrogenase